MMSGAAAEQRPTFTHPRHHHPLNLTATGPTDHSMACTACTSPIQSGKDSYYYSCSQCSLFCLHSSCFKMPPSLRHPSHPNHDLHRFSSSPYGIGVGFSCDLCRNPGLPYQWLYRCNLCDFDIHIECPAVKSAITTTRSALTAAPAQPPPPAGYPPILPATGSGVGIGIGPNQAQPKFVGIRPNQAQPNFVGIGPNQQQPNFVGIGPNQAQPNFVGIGPNQAQPQIIGTTAYPNAVAYPNNIQAMGAGPVAPGMGMGMGGLVMGGIGAGIGEGIGQGIVQTAWNGSGHDDSSGCSDHSSFF